MKEYDESPFSGLIASKYQTTHHPILLSPDRLLSELPNALNAMDSPSVDGMNLYVISKLTKAGGMTVAMSGLGADELFAGYHYFNLWRKMKRYGFFLLPPGIRLAVAKNKYGQRDASRMERMEQLASSDGSIAETYPVFRQVSGTKKAMELTRQKMVGQKMR
jgi:asparagine synthase (glutamine-hydrolysing)